MPNPIVFFEIGCRDLNKIGDFYEKLLGWSLPAQPGGMTRNLDTREGIPGHLIAMGHEPHNFVNVYAQVNNLEESIEQAKSLGGALVVGPAPVPGRGRFAWISDPEGTHFGLWEVAKG